MSRIGKHLLRAFIPLRTFLLFRRWRVSSVFDDWFEGAPKSPTLRGIFAEAYGDDYAREADPMSFIYLPPPPQQRYPQSTVRSSRQVSRSWGERSWPKIAYSMPYAGR